MKNYVIVGAGPIGLYWAAKLAKIQKTSEIPITITVVDSREGNYKRERIVSNQAIKLISSQLSIEMKSAKGIPSEAMYIRDFENSLYQYCKKNKVKFINGTFSELGEKSVIYKDPENEQHKINCDMIIDCSGSNRVVLKETNRLLKKEIFEIKTLGKNPHTNHFSCYMSLSNEEGKKLNTPKEIDPLLQAKQLAKLRKEYGWPDFSFPDVDIRSAENEKNGLNYFIYYEVPDDLKKRDKEIQIEFLKDLLKLKYGFEDIDFKINSFGHFEVSPEYVDKPFYQDKDLPMILPGGDCQIEPDYRKGIGIESGIERANSFLNTVFIKKNELEFSYESYYQEVAKYMNYHGLQIEQFYQQRRDNINSYSLKQAKKILFAAAEMVKKKEDIITIAGELKLLGNELFKKPNYSGALECYLSAIKLYQSIDPTVDYITVHSNACQVCLNLKKYKTCVSLAEDGIKAYLKIEKGDPGILFKLLFRKASALTEMINELNVSSQKEEIETLLKNLCETHELMQKNTSESNKTFVEQIKGKINSIENELYPSKIVLGN